MGAASSVHNGWHYDPSNSRLDVYYRGTRVGHFNTSGLTILGTAQTANAFNDDVVVTFGTDGDVAYVERSTTLNATTALTSVIIGTPVTAATPADSLLISNKTASGDIAYFLNDGSGNSQEWLRFDSSAGLLVVNEASADLDFRIETNGNSNGIVFDGNTDSVGLGSAVVAGAPLSISNLTGRTLVTSVGHQLHVPAGTMTDGGGTGTIAVLAPVYVGAQTIVATNTITYTDAQGLRVKNPVASTGATFTRIRTIGSEGNIQIGAEASFATTSPTASLVIKTGTAPVGAITTSVALYTDGTVMKKIIADGTASNVET